MEPRLAPLMIAAEAGDGASRQALFTLLYDELGRLARRELRKGGAQITLGASTLVHEVYLSLASRDGAEFPDRARFLAYAARAMRGIIIDYARRRCAQKRGGGFHITSMQTEPGVPAADPAELMRIDQALDELAEVDEALAQVVDLKFFCGYSFGEIAELRGVSVRTVQRQWDKARIYLHTRLNSLKVD